MLWNIINIKSINIKRKITYEYKKLIGKFYAEIKSLKKVKESEKYVKKSLKYTVLKKRV